MYSSEKPVKAGMSHILSIVTGGLLLAVTTALFGSIFGHGESASYIVWNTVKPGITDVEITRINKGKRTPLFSAGQIALTGRGTPGLGGNLYLADRGHTIPEEVEIRWRKWPVGTQKWYDSDPVAPHRVPVRARIPSEVLEQVRSNDYAVELKFGAGGERVLLEWHLFQIKGMKLLRSGGDLE